MCRRNLLVASCIIAFSAFEYWVAFVALFMTVFGDMFSAIVGRAFGKIVIYKNKTLKAQWPVLCELNCRTFNSSGLFSFDCSNGFYRDCG